MNSEDVTLNDDERQRVEVWTRVMGYHRPVESFNAGKKREFEDRLPFFHAAYQDRIHPPTGPLITATPVCGDWRVTTDIRVQTGAAFDTCGDVRSTSAGAPPPR